MNQPIGQIQVSKDHYFSKYDNVERFISYYYQIQSIVKSSPQTVLEIGVGNKTVSNYLKQSDYTVTTCDFDPDLGPDVVGDIRNLPFEDASFDTVAAFEILEHLPFSEFQKSLKELKRVSKGNVIISFPYACAHLEILTKIAIPFFSKKFHLAFRFPYFFHKVVMNERNKEHYWEMGTNGYSKRKIRNIIKKEFSIVSEFQPMLNSYHYFFVLKK